MTPTKFTLNNVFAKKMVIRMLTVRSYEMNIYLVEREVG
jgi:hypothetical protein